MDIKQRVKVVEYFLQVRSNLSFFRSLGSDLHRTVQLAKYCEELHNFNALMEITSSLNASPVHRLRNTWKLVASKLVGWKEEWDKLTLMNYTRYRPAFLGSP